MFDTPQTRILLLKCVLATFGMSMEDTKMNLYSHLYSTAGEDDLQN